MRSIVRPPNAGKGRPKGTPNKATHEIRVLTQRLFDQVYWTATKERLMAGRLPPAVETKLLAYAYGEPKLTVDLLGVTELAAMLARKCIDELHPSPTKTA